MTEPLIADAAVKAIQDSVATGTIEIGGDRFVTRPVFPPPIEALAETLTVHTLSGLVDYLASNVDRLTWDELAIHIVGPGAVNLVTMFEGRPRRRNVIIAVKFDGLGFKFGHFYSCEEFNITLQSLFVDDADRAGVLKVVGNIKQEAVGQFDDDGITQTVTARAGIARVETVAVPNPVTLKPYRTFLEVEQPESPFVLRVKGSDSGNMPSCALFEADGQRWKLAAIENIARHLRVKIAELDEPMDSIAVIA